MIYKLLSVNSNTIPINIGDYIQALASAQFLPHIDGFVPREALNTYHGGKCAVIMNGWFMHNPQKWPPSDNIIPLFVAFHINTYTNGEMLGKDGVAYLKRYEPIGCRDYNTCEQLAKFGIKCYFTGCMTLTLGIKYKNAQKTDKVYFVDPFFKCRWSKIDLLKNIPFYVANKKVIDKVSSKIPFGLSGLKKKLRVVDFYREYSQFFTKDTLTNSNFVCQMSSYYNEHFPTDDELLKEAERLVSLYSRAGLVITSRIHCALPCLGLQTPVIYIENCNQDEVSSCRMKGLRELFNIMEWENGKLIPKFTFEGKISVSNPPKNKTNWKELAINLSDKVLKFIRNVDI